MSSEVRETRFHCTICDKYYASYKSFGNHTRSYHSKNKEKAICEYCGNSFTRKDNLQQHIKLFHSSVQVTYSCTYCGKVFNSRSQCSKHKKHCSQQLIDIPEKQQVGLFTIQNNNNNNNIISRHLPLLSSDLHHPITDKSNVGTDKTHFVKTDHDMTRRTETFDSPSSLGTNTAYENNNTEAESCGHAGHVDDSSLDVQNKALDCNVCNITFLSLADYISHKPFCHNDVS